MNICTIVYMLLVCTRRVNCGLPRCEGTQT